MGLEPTSEFFIDHLVEIFSEVKRVLKKTGTLWIVISDTYFGSGCGTNDYKTPASISLSIPKLYDGPRPQNVTKHPYLKPKSLTMIPERLAWALIQDGWRLRNKIIWDKPNYMPSSAKDRFTNKYEFILFLTKGKQYFFDMEAVREPYTRPLDRWGGDKLIDKGKGTWSKGTGQPLYRERELRPNPAGKQPTDIWTIPTKPCEVKGVHYATFPEELCTKAISAGCPPEICRKCGKPKTRIIQKTTEMGKKSKDKRGGNIKVGKKSTLYYKEKEVFIKSLGWTSCKCNAGHEGGILLDPFCGIGTACVVAKKLGRRYLGIDLKKEYIKTARDLMGRWLF